jgi:hypothetical protein
MNALANPNSRSLSPHQTWALRASWLLALAVAFAMLIYGPIAQLADYHNFADQRAWQGIPCFADVISNIGFMMAGAYGLWHYRLKTPGYALFLLFLLLTGFGSGYYHWEPNNARLIWDRLPISLVCSGLLVGSYFELDPKKQEGLWTLGMAAFAIFGVWWWHVTEQKGEGDLRPYLYLQLLPLLVIPLWQYAFSAPKRTKQAFAFAIGFYALAKIFELLDHPVFETLGFISGHSIKHLLATAGGACIVWHLTSKTVSDRKKARVL